MSVHNGVSPASNQSQSLPSRNPRRRQRKDGDEGGSLRSQPQRKKSKINAATAVSIYTAPLEADEAQEYQMNGHVRNASRGREGSSVPSTFPLRTKHAAKRIHREHGYQLLAKNSHYDVEQLHGLPSQLGSGDCAQRVVIHAATGRTLSITKKKAIIWDYKSTSPEPNTQEFLLPNPATDSEHVPFASFCSNEPSNEIGLIVVNTTSGKITLWESIENANTISLFEKHRKGIEGSCGSLMYGEIVTGLDAAGHAGFIITFSSGRVAQLLLRDQQSRTSISVNFLKGSRGSAGLFGGLKSVFGVGTSLKNIAAVATRPSATRGETQIVVATREAIFQLWRLNWSGQTVLVGEVNAFSTIASALDMSNHPSSVQILDIAFMTSSSTQLQKGNDSPAESETTLITLLQSLSIDAIQYFLIELDMAPDQATVSRVIRLQYSTLLDHKGVSDRTQLCVVDNPSTAIVVFEKAFSVISLVPTSSGQESEAQLELDYKPLPEPFQDTIHLKTKEYDVPVVNGCVEEATNRETGTRSTLLFLRGARPLRIRVAKQPPGEPASHLPAKSKLEQAAFLGIIPSNPLNLARKPDVEYSLKEIEDAAISISHEILETNSEFLRTVAPSVSKHLEDRARSLEILAEYVMTNYPNIQRRAKWRLRWNAEKMATARAIWDWYNGIITTQDQSNALLWHEVQMLDEKYKTEPAEDPLGYDHVRQWFLKDVSAISQLLPSAYTAMNELNKADYFDSAQKMIDFASQANDLFLVGLETAYTFREEASSLYGLENEQLQDGVLTSGYAGLDEPWTCVYQSIVKVQSMITNSKEIAEKFVDHKNKDRPDEQLLFKIAADVPRLIEVCCKIYEERSRWYSEQEDEKARDSGKSLAEAYEQIRFEFLVDLPAMGLTQSGFEIAERHHDLQALVVLLIEDISYFHAERNRDLDAEEDYEVAKSLKALELRLKGYFSKYGDAFGDVYLNFHARKRLYSTIVDLPNHVELARWLKADPKRAKLAWMDEALRLKDFASVGRDILDVAVNQESDFWSKKIETSMAKLALIAAQQGDETREEVTSMVTKQENALELVHIQEKLYDHIGPSFYGAIDSAAELQLALETFGTHVSAGRPALQQLFERGLETLLSHSVMEIAQLVDVLTLMDQRNCDLRHSNIAGQEFVLALKALQAASLPTDQYDLLSKLVWRRIFIADDWRILNASGNASDEAILESLRETNLFTAICVGRRIDVSKRAGHSMIAVPSPISINGVGISPDELSWRFEDSGIREHISRDLQKEDGLLKEFVEECRLEHWLK